MQNKPIERDRQETLVFGFISEMQHSRKIINVVTRDVSKAFDKLS